MERNLAGVGWRAVTANNDKEGYAGIRSALNSPGYDGDDNQSVTALDHQPVASKLPVNQNFSSWSSRACTFLIIFLTWWLEQRWSLCSCLKICIQRVSTLNSILHEYKSISLNQTSPLMNHFQLISVTSKTSYTQPCNIKA